VPYPSFKSIKHRDRVPLELLVVVVIGVAAMITMSQLTLFLLSSAYVLSGPLLFLRGQRIAPAPSAESGYRQNHTAGAADEKTTQSIEA
jgi:phosphatidylserine synthase